MSYSYLLLWFVVSTLVITPHASPVKMDNQAPSIPRTVHTVNIRLIEESHDHPMKRSAQTLNLPDNLVFGVPGDGTSSDTILRLKRATLIPMVTSRGEKIAPHQSASVYTDPSLHSAMIVRRESEQYTLEGTFLCSGVEWNLKPMGKNVTDKSAHQLESNSFKGDLHRGLVKSKAKTSASNLVRHKRAEKEVLTIETAFVIDYSAYILLFTVFGPTDVVIETQLFYTYVAEAVHLRFQALEYEDIEVKFKALSLKMITSSDDDAFIEDETDGGEIITKNAMNAFSGWFWTQDDTYQDTDYHVLFTEFGVPGEIPSYSFSDMMCEKGAGSIVRQILDGFLSFMVARELMIVFGLDNDDLGCDIVDHNLGPQIIWKLPDCAAEVLYGKLQSDSSCLNAAATASETSLPFPEDSARAGQVKDRDAQCQLSFRNPQASYCPDSQGEEETICGNMYCKPEFGAVSCLPILPQEFTTCGENMWCELGQCVADDTTKPPPPPVSEKVCRKMRLRPRKWIACIRKILKL